MHSSHFAAAKIQGEDLDVDVKFNEGLTILHGPNDSGKSLLLSVLHAVSQENWSALKRMPFSHIRLELVCGDTLEVHRQPGLAFDIRVTAAVPQFRTAPTSFVGVAPRQTLRDKLARINYKAATLVPNLPPLVANGHIVHPTTKGYDTGRYGEGTLRALAREHDLAVKGPAPRILLLESPETGQHPVEQRKLPEKLLQLAYQGYQVLVTTHSPYISADRTDLMVQVGGYC